MLTFRLDDQYQDSGAEIKLKYSEHTSVLPGKILSRRICIVNHHDIYLKHLTILFVNYSSIKLKKNFF